DQSIAPTWTNNHLWAATLTSPLGINVTDSSTATGAASIVSMGAGAIGGTARMAFYLSGNTDPVSGNPGGEHMSIGTVSNADPISIHTQGVERMRIGSS